MIKAIGYFRVLLDISDTEPDILSPQVEQEKGFYSFCQEQGYDPITTFMDVDSGDKVSETQYQHMIRYIRKQHEDFHIVVKNLPTLRKRYAVSWSLMVLG
jgi:hypothetical protein